MNPVEQFRREVCTEIEGMKADAAVRALSRVWVREITRHKYAYHFTWLGRPIIQFPTDLVAIQEIVWRVKPDLIVETGIAHGGSLIFYASLLDMIGGAGRVVGIDVDIRPHNRREIERHPMARRITMIGGSSTAPAVVRNVRALASKRRRVMVVLDSNHAHDHVLRELRAYAPMVTKHSYLIVCDTLIEEMPAEFFKGKPWGRGNNPMTAVREFLRGTHRFVADEAVEAKLLITVAPGGYLKCVRD